VTGTPATPLLIDGPYYEDLLVGRVFDTSPALRLTHGHAAVHQAVLGERLRLALDAQLCTAVTGEEASLAHPALVWDVAIGQSTTVTQRVVANLFYRGLVLHRMPRIGDTLRTVTEVVALRDNAPREGRPPTGLAALRIRTTDQSERVVLDFHRCAMLPMRDESARPGHADDLAVIPDELPDPEVLATAATGWSLDAFRDRVPGPHGADLVAGAAYDIAVGDTVTAAPELARLTLNLAAVHVDPTASAHGRRLVFGGHTIGLALSQTMRALPSIVTVLGWRSCDHVGPVFEGDVLRSVVTVEGVTALPAGGVLADLRIEATAQREEQRSSAVLDWRLVALFA
jgi:acyl dehydratase